MGSPAGAQQQPVITFTQTDEIHHVLWTGGWDSSFRVLWLVLVEGRTVQPHYIIDPHRHSTQYERAAMTAISGALQARTAAGTLLPLRATALADIPIREQARAAHADLVRRYGIGAQYVWLSEYLHWQGLEHLELGIHVDDKAHAVVLTPAFAQGGGSEALLAGFRFPILHLSKPQMHELASQHGFEDILALSWFCHRPTRSGQPCGLCNPCRWTAAEGLPWRLPEGAHWRDRVDRQWIQRLPSMRLRRSLRELLRRYA